MPATPKRARSRPTEPSRARQASPGRSESPRADARRNIAAILDAAQDCLARDPEASTGTIAKTAGVGRVTLYGHFASRTELIEAVLARTITDAEQTLDQIDLTGEPHKALVRLVTSSWQIIDRHRALLRAAQRTLPAERIRASHDKPLRRVRDLIKHGQETGAFRTDLPTPWLVTTFYTVLHAAADEINTGGLDTDSAGSTIAATLLATLTPPGARVPAAEAD